MEMSCQETVQTCGYVWGICWQRVDTISTCKCVITAVSWFEVNQIWQSLVFLPHLLIFAGPGVLRNHLSRGGCVCCRKQLAASVWMVCHRDASYSSSTRKYLHTCIDCHRSGHSDCSYCGHATPSIRDNFMNCKGYNLCAGSTHGFTEDFLVTLRGFDRMYGRIRH